MKNFHVIGSCDTSNLLEQLRHREDLWNQHPDRLIGFNMMGDAEFDDIWVHMPISMSETTRDEIMAKVNTLPYNNLWKQAYFELPAIKPILYTLFARFDGESFGRVFISRLAPGKTIFPHEDQNLKPFARFHVALESAEGQVFECLDEKFTPKTGEIFWFDNQSTHAVYNDSDKPRLTMVIDMITPYQDYLFGRKFAEEAT